jgi:hypothetical protein
MGKPGGEASHKTGRGHEIVRRGRISTNPIASYQRQTAPIGAAIDLVSLVPEVAAD